MPGSYIASWDGTSAAAEADITGWLRVTAGGIVLQVMRPAYDVGAVPIGVCVKAWPDDQWTIKYLDYWVPHSDFGKTNSAKHVLAELIRQHDVRERKDVA